jgi:ectoine hydroxylase-related dioxygenase (phytanoyl-CoA dioxygenase family)
MSRQQFQDDGFSIFSEPIVPLELVERANHGMDELIAGCYDTGEPPVSGWEPGSDPNQLIKIESPHFANHAIRELISHPAIGEYAAALTGADMVQVWWVQMLHKPPVQSGLANSVGWHQDRSYWTCWREGSELLTCWLALSDVTAESGPMNFVRGSHRWGLVEGSDFFGQDNDDIKAGLDIPADATWEECSVIIPAGGASFHDRLTVHGSGANISAAPRRSFAIHLRTEKAEAEADITSRLVRYLGDPVRNPVIFGDLIR